MEQNDNNIKIMVFFFLYSILKIIKNTDIKNYFEILTIGINVFIYFFNFQKQK